MSDQPWRPLGVESDEEVSTYDALHDGLTPWMTAAFWTWIRAAIAKEGRYQAGTSYNPRVERFPYLDVELAERMCQILRIPLANLRGDQTLPSTGSSRLSDALSFLKKHPAPLQIADYLLAHGGHGSVEELESILSRSKSAWTVGTRSGKPALVRRVPFGVQLAANDVMSRSGRAGARLARAWEELYGLSPNPSESYRLAILAVEDAAIPVVSPTNLSATLGTVLKQIEDQKDWKLPMVREHSGAPSTEVVVAMLRMLWHGQHDRHGGQPSAPGDVSLEEAQVAVSISVTLVNLFEGGLVQRSTL